MRLTSSDVLMHRQRRLRPIRAHLVAWTLVTAVVALLAGCSGYDASLYKGDGTLVDRGWLSGSDRYFLDLGAVDLRQRGSREYRMTGLPSERLVLGLQVAHAEGVANAGRGLVPASKIRVEMKSASGTLVGHEEDMLDRWVVSTGGGDPVFAYCPGPRDVNWTEQIGSAWGCVFKPKFEDRYTLRIEVVEPDPDATGYSVKLVIKGGPRDLLP